MSCNRESKVQYSKPIEGEYIKKKLHDIEGEVLQSAVFSPTNFTHLKHSILNPCLDTDDRRSLGELGDVTLHSSHFKDLSIVYRQARTFQ